MKTTNKNNSRPLSHLKFFNSSIFRDDSLSQFVLSYGDETLAIGYDDFETFVLGQIAVGLANQMLSPSRLESLLDSRPWANFASSSASAASVRQEIVQRDAKFPSLSLKLHGKKRNKQHLIEGLRLDNKMAESFRF